MDPVFRTENNGEIRLLKGYTDFLSIRGSKAQTMLKKNIIVLYSYSLEELFRVT